MSDKNVSGVSAENMSEAAKKLRSQYNREWAKKNRERKNAINRAYWERKAARMVAEQAEGGNADGNE